MATPDKYYMIDDAEMLRVFRAGNRSPEVMSDLRRRGLHAEIGEERPTDWTPNSAPVIPPSFTFRQTPAEMAATQKDADYRPFLTLLGILLFGVGIYFLLVNPGAGEVLGTEIANLQKLTLGETFCISGAVLFAAGMRPVRL